MIYRFDDPLAAPLVGPGGPYEVMPAQLRGESCEVYRDHPHTLIGIYDVARGRGDARMVQETARAWTYDQVFQLADALSATLQDRFGVKHGTRVAIATGSRMEWLAGVIAVSQIGAVAVLINTRGTREEMVRAITVVNGEVVLADRERAQVLLDGEAPWPMILVGAADLARPGDLTFEQASAGDAKPAAVALAPEDGAVVMFTSGTTGFPKGALLTHGSVSHAVVTAALTCDLHDLTHAKEFGRPFDPDRPSKSSPTVVAGPLFHVGGLIPFLRSIYCGAPLFLMARWNADVAFDLIEGEGLSRMSFVPTMMWDMLNSPRASNGNLGAIKHLVNGAAPLPPALVKEIVARLPDCMLWTSYGSTETSGAAATFGGREYLENPTGCGRPLPTMRMRILRDDGSDAAPGEPGEIAVSGAAIFSGYHDPKATEEAFEGAWYRMGDIGFMDEHERLQVVDRKKNMVISGGENIYCAEIERVLNEHPAVRESLAYGLPDPRLGERLVVTVVPNPGASVGAEDLQAHVRAHLAIYKVPREVRFSHEPLPRTATGKEDRGRFRRELQAAGELAKA
jgi:long-chain acyl-CoA synthetase